MKQAAEKTTQVAQTNAEKQFIPFAVSRIIHCGKNPALSSLTAVFLLFLLIGTAVAAPTLPLQIYGTAGTEDGTPLAEGTEITALINGETFTYVITETGQIGGKGVFDDKFVVGPENTVSGTITFTVAGTAAQQEVTYQSGETVEIKLTFPDTIAQTVPQSTTEQTQHPTTEPTQTSSNTENPAGGSSSSRDTTPPGTYPETSIWQTEPQTSELTSTESQTPLPTPVASIPRTPTENAATPFPVVSLIAGFVGAALFFLETERRK